MDDPRVMRKLKCRCGGTPEITATLAGISLCDEKDTPVGAVIECECPRCRQRFTLTDWFYVPISVSEDARDGA